MKSKTLKLLRAAISDHPLAELITIEEMQDLNSFIVQLEAIERMNKIRSAYEETVREM